MLSSSLAVFFWMLGQDVKRGLLAEWGFQTLSGRARIYSKGNLLLHQLGLGYQTEAAVLAFARPGRRLASYPPRALPPFTGQPGQPLRESEFRRCVLPELLPYEGWVRARMGADYRRQLLRICPPGLRPLRQHWKADFNHPLSDKESL